MEIKQIMGNTYCIDTGMTYIPFYKTNDREIIMLDSGWGQGEREGIDNLLEANNLRPIGIISSHAHVDHIGNNAYFKQKYKCLIAMSLTEALSCSSIINLKVYFASQPVTNIVRHFGHLVCKTDDVIFETENAINFCGINFKIVHTPGHSPAHICIGTPDDVAYLGDSLISYEVMESAKMPYAYILQEDLKSKMKLYEMKACKYIVAHKGIYDDVTQLITDNIKFYKYRASRVCAAIDGVMTFEEIMKAIIADFNMEIKSMFKYSVIERMLKSYIEYLVDIGEVKQCIDDGLLKYAVQHPALSETTHRVV